MACNAETAARKLMVKVNRLDPAGAEKRKTEWESITLMKGTTKVANVSKFKTEMKAKLK